MVMVINDNNNKIGGNVEFRVQILEMMDTQRTEPDWLQQLSTKFACGL